MWYICRIMQSANTYLIHDSYKQDETHISLVVNGVPPQHTTYDARRCPHNGSFSCRRKSMTTAVVLSTTYFRSITEWCTNDAGKWPLHVVHTMVLLDHMKVRICVSSVALHIIFDYMELIILPNTTYRSHKIVFFIHYSMSPKIRQHVCWLYTNPHHTAFEWLLRHVHFVFKPTQCTCKLTSQVVFLWCVQMH